MRKMVSSHIEKMIDRERQGATDLTSICEWMAGWGEELLANLEKIREKR